MKAVLDACVLYPTVTRELLIEAAAEGFFQPLWSARLLEEWARAAARRGPAEEAQARGEIALLRAAWPQAEGSWTESLERRLWLPDGNDIHVLALAVATGAEAIVTVNRADFPRHILAEEGVSRADPDALMLGFHQADAPRMARAAGRVLDRARALSSGEWDMRPLLKKARLPRLAKALG